MFIRVTLNGASFMGRLVEGSYDESTLCATIIHLDGDWEAQGVSHFGLDETVLLVKLADGWYSINGIKLDSVQHGTLTFQET